MLHAINTTDLSCEDICVVLPLSHMQSLRAVHISFLVHVYYVLPVTCVLTSVQNISNLWALFFTHQWQCFDTTLPLHQQLSNCVSNGSMPQQQLTV
jgi:hypothetical protein